MVKRVLDTSVIVKWFLPEEGSDRAELFLRELEQGAGRVLVPSSFYYEFCNVLWVRRRDGLQVSVARAIWKELTQLPLEVSHGADLLTPALSFSYRHEISPYDAVFVVLAQQQESELVTADGPLWRKLNAEYSWVRQL